MLLSAVLVTTLDFFVVNAALPAIERDLGASDTALRFVVAGYGLAYAAGLITAARLGELYGQRRVFSVGVAAFTGASAGCGLAGDAAGLVGCRIVQGAAAALMAPQVLVLIGELYPAGAGRARAFGRYGATVGLAGVGGQVVGGLLIAADPAGLGWRTCFLVNLPLGIAALVLTPRSIPAPPPSATPPSASPEESLDPVGALLVAAGLTAAAWPFLHGGGAGPASWRLLCTAGAVVLLAGFVRHQHGRVRTGRRPLLDPALFRERGLPLGLAAVALLFGASAALSTVLPLYLQLGCGIGPLAAGGVAAALNVGFLVAAAGTGWLYGRFGDRLSTGGALLLAGGLGVAAGAPGAGSVAVPVLMLGLLLSGAGMGLVMAPLTSAVLAGVAPARVAAVSGVVGTFQEMGGVLGGAVAASAFFGVLGGPTGAIPANAPRWDAAFRAGIAVLVLFALAVALLTTLHRRGSRTRSRTIVVPTEPPATTRR
ncbi:MFS transporter [Embleya sp. NBC_00896]|uniref:MFS transporter n=1 Tax=Embleya sp. NBC_00896 TaxID=2975961 RepID=UPI003867A273|nr:MFS transporter [Embleya sp. NBC_00896]